ncbi:unnamed protein product [Urochloa humidicola]
MSVWRVGSAASSDANSTRGGTPRRPLVLRLRRPGCTAFGIGVVPDLNSPATANGGTGFGPQAGPSTGGIPAITSFTAANAMSGFVGVTTTTHPGFTAGTMAARRGTPPFFNFGGPSTAAPQAASASTAMAALTTPPSPASPRSVLEPPASSSSSMEASPSAADPDWAALVARNLRRRVAIDRRPGGRRRGTWSPVALGFSSGN